MKVKPIATSPRVLRTAALDVLGLEGVSGQPIAWGVAKPYDLQKSHGIDLTLARLEEMAAAYDPEVEAAAINFDHASHGPAEGWVEEAWVDDGVLWVRPVDLSEQLQDHVRRRRYRRASIEINLKHPETGGWYLSGLGLLGSKNPAVKGLPEIHLSDRRRFVAVPDPSTPPHQEPTMTKNNDQPNTPDATPEEPKAPPATPTPSPTAASLATDRKALDDERKALAEERRLAREERLAARRERIEAQVEKSLAELGRRVTPAMKRAGLQQALVALASAETPASVQLSDPKGNIGEHPVFEVLLAVLAGLPEFTKLTGRLDARDASEDGESPSARDPRTAQERALHARHGIDDKRIAELSERFGLYQEDPDPAEAN